MTLAPLPERLASATVPFFLSPAKFSMIRKCMLRAIARIDKPGVLLPPAPSVLLGLSTHHAREQYLKGNWGTSSTAVDAADLILDSTITDLDGCLEADQRTKAMSPFKRAIGRTKWNRARDELRRWARLRDVRSGRQQPDRFLLRLDNQRAGKAASEGSDSTLRFGPEVWIESRDLRIRGRVDRIEEKPDAIEIYEFKSGLVETVDGAPLDEHAEQVRLYALVVESMLPGRAVRLFIEADTPIRVDWSPEIRDRTQQALQATLESLPEGKLIHAEAIANPGSTCCGCRIRHCCGPYLDVAPQWWHNRPDAPRPLPLDVWGEVTSLSEDEDYVSMRLRDAGERGVRIEGLDVDRVSWLSVNDPVFFFNLEPTEPVLQHGARVQPRNFHEYPPDGGQVLRRAFQLQVFRG